METSAEYEKISDICEEVGKITAEEINRVRELISIDEEDRNPLIDKYVKYNNDVLDAFVHLKAVIEATPEPEKMWWTNPKTAQYADVAQVARAFRK